MTTVTLFGPQRLKPTVIQAVRDRKIVGRIATITAGWQDREDEDKELDAHLDGKTLNLRLYHRTEEIFRDDPDFHQGFRARQDDLQQLQRIYRLRLEHALAPARRLRNWPVDKPFVKPHLRSAIEAVRQLDQEHLENVEQIHQKFDTDWHPEQRGAVARHREEVARLLTEEACDAVAIAGGHVAVLINRLRLFGFSQLLGRRPLFAWAGGAMVTGERVVLFHDSPPQGPGNAEVLDVGLGLHRGLVPLPHARRRLRLADRDRVSLFARRFEPALCVALEQGDRVDKTTQGWHADPGILCLTGSGELEEVGTR